MCSSKSNSDFRKDWQQVDGPRISKLSFKANVSRAFEGGFSDKAPERLCFICWKELARAFILRGECDIFHELLNVVAYSHERDKTISGHT
jgi:hypothetical protein